MLFKKKRIFDRSKYMTYYCMISSEIKKLNWILMTAISLNSMFLGWYDFQFKENQWFRIKCNNSFKYYKVHNSKMYNFCKKKSSTDHFFCNLLD